MEQSACIEIKSKPTELQQAIRAAKHFLPNQQSSVFLRYLLQQALPTTSPKSASRFPIQEGKVLKCKRKKKRTGNNEIMRVGAKVSIIRKRGQATVYESLLRSLSG